MLPNFIICGAQKGGTTSLYHYLRQHPEIFMPEEKEVDFFANNIEKGVAWYEAFFEGAEGYGAVGEASPNYMWREETVDGMSKMVPDARLIFILRNPIRRAYSNYWFNVSRGLQRVQMPFSQAIREEPGYRNYVTKGFYYEQIARFLKHYPREKILVVLLEDLLKNPEETMKNCYQFLGVNTAFIPSLGEKHNVTVLPKNRLVFMAFNLWVPIRRALSKITPPQVRRVIGMPRTWIRARLFSQAKPPSMAETDRVWLAEAFAEHNRQLSQFLNRDLSFWN